MPNCSRTWIDALNNNRNDWKLIPPANSVQTRLATVKTVHLFVLVLCFSSTIAQFYVWLFLSFQTPYVLLHLLSIVWHFSTLGAFSSFVRGSHLTFELVLWWVAYFFCVHFSSTVIFFPLTLIFFPLLMRPHQSLSVYFGESRPTSFFLQVFQV